MKKIITLLLILATVFTLILTGCGAQSKDTYNDIVEAGKFIVGLDDTFAPMGFRDENDELVGLDIDLARVVAEKMGLEVEFKSIDWGSKEMELNSKNIDMIWNGFSINEDRKKNVLFSDPYLDNTQIIVVMEGTDIKTKADFAGKKIGVQVESSAKAAVEAETAIADSIKELVEYPENFEALMDLAIGRIDAVVVDEVLGKYYIAKNPEGYIVLDDDFGSEEYGVGFRLGDKKLVAEFNKAFNSLKEDGTTTEISIKWFGEDIVK